MSDNSKITTLLPDNIAALTAYSSAKSEKLTGTTWLNANESPYSRTPNINLADLNRYPDPQPQQVINRYACYANLEPEQVLMTSGADEGHQYVLFVAQLKIALHSFCQLTACTK